MSQPWQSFSGNSVMPLSPRSEDLINISPNTSMHYVPFYGTPGSIIAIIILLVFIFLLAIGNILFSWYLFQMGDGSNKRTNKLLKDVENAVWEVRKSCNAIKSSSKAPPAPTKIEMEEENEDEQEGKSVIINSRYLTSTPDRNKSAANDIEIISPITGQRSLGHTTPKKLIPESIRMTHFSSATTIPENHDQALEMMSNVIDQSFDRMIDKVDPYRHQNKTK